MLSGWCRRRGFPARGGFGLLSPFLRPSGCRHCEMSPMRSSLATRLFLLILAAMLAAGCHRDKKTEETEVLPVERMYEVGKEALSNGNNTKAIKYYQRLIARFPFGPYTEQA